MKLKFLAICLATTFALGGTVAHAQAVSSGALDLGVSYAAQRSLKAGTGQNFWTQGGAIELGANVWHGLGIAANVTGTHTASVGASNIPLSLVTTTFGPRFRFHAARRLSIYAEALVGEANGFGSVFPAPRASQDSANGLALQFGGGIDYKLGHRYAVRVLDASYVRTQLPNSSDNVQNNLHLGAGFVLRFH